MLFLRPSGRVLFWTALTSLTALVSRWVSDAVASYPRARQAGPLAACNPAAARDEQRLADSPAWRIVEWLLVRRALTPFRERPGFERLRILNVDFGPGGVAVALRRQAPLDSVVVGTDSVSGMGDLALHRARRRGAHRPLLLSQAWGHALPFRDGSFHLVVASGALHGWIAPEQALAEIKRVLTPDGRYLVADFRRDLPLPYWLVLQLVQTLFTPKDLRALGEPRASVRAAYAPHEAEWLAGRAGLPQISLLPGIGWLMMERQGAASPRRYTLS
ncbi:MAG TPA: class I SAM-dependent methyltransferase [Chloroflexota bacterium]|nr:class I SAM-dependent methyltransferase [Chloroflexota bacterium]